MAFQSSRPSVAAISLEDLNPLTAPLNYINKSLTYFREKEHAFHRSFPESFCFHKIPTAPSKEEEEASAEGEENTNEDNLNVPKEASHPTKLKALKIKFKMIFKKKSKKEDSNQQKSSSIEDNSVTTFQPLTVTVERLQELHKKMECNIRELQDVMRITTVEELLTRMEKEVIDEIDSTSSFQSIFIDEEVNAESGDEIHAVMFQPDHPLKVKDNIPLVMIHGLGGGLGSFHKNYGHLNYDRYVYGLDLPGFARSSRMEFPDIAEESKEMMVDMLEKWRDGMKIKKFILLGHSFGGYIASAYAVKYPANVRHLILVEPWGIISKDEEMNSRKTEAWQQIAMDIFSYFNIEPFDPLRWSISLGTVLMDLFVPNGQKDSYGEKCMKYFLYANGLPNATGEKAYATISGYTYLWAKEGMEMKQPLVDMDPSIPMTVMYGEHSNFYNQGGADIQKSRQNVHIYVFNQATHHMHAQKDQVFNKQLKKVLEEIADGKDHHREEKTFAIDDEEDGEENPRK